METVDELQLRVVARIRECAEARGVQLSHVADRAGVSRSHFWDVLAGRKSPTLKWLVAVAEALEVDAGDLLASTPPTSWTRPLRLERG